MNSYKTLYEYLERDLKDKNFLSRKKILKHHRIYKFFTTLSFLLLISSLIPYFKDYKFTIAIIGIVSVLFFEGKSRGFKDKLNIGDSYLESIFTGYLNSDLIKDFRKNKLNELELGSLQKRDYLIIIKEELHLIYNLIKSECENDLKIDVITYKNDVNHIFDVLNLALEQNLITKDDFRTLDKKWVSDIQILCNQYTKTELEIDLKYLQKLSNSTIN